MWAKQWDHTFHIADIWKNDELTFEQRRDAITKRMRRQPWFEVFEEDCGIISDLEAAEDPDDWDEWWDQFYDWCDDGKRVWVKLI